MGAQEPSQSWAGTGSLVPFSWAECCGLKTLEGGQGWEGGQGEGWSPVPSSLFCWGWAGGLLEPGQHGAAISLASVLCPVCCVCPTCRLPSAEGCQQDAVTSQVCSLAVAVGVLGLATGAGPPVPQLQAGAGLPRSLLLTRGRETWRACVKVNGPFDDCPVLCT